MIERTRCVFAKDCDDYAIYRARHPNNGKSKGIIIFDGRECYCEMRRELEEEGIETPKCLVILWLEKIDDISKDTRYLREVADNKNNKRVDINECIKDITKKIME